MQDVINNNKYANNYDYNKTNLIEWVKYLHAKSEETEEKKQVRERELA